MQLKKYITFQTGELEGSEVSRKIKLYLSQIDYLYW